MLTSRALSDAAPSRGRQCAASGSVKASVVNRDYHVTFTPEERETGRAYYDHATGSFGAPEGPGISVFYREDAGAIYHTYSAYARGLDMVNGADHVLDLVPKGRDQGGLSYPLEWVPRHDAYQTPPPVIIATGLSKRS